MQTEMYYIIYLILFRLMIIAAGMLSIYLGYRLFIQGITEINRGSSLDSSFAGMSFKLQNVAPGTFFAIFGVIIISVMLGASPPQFESSQGSANTVEGQMLAEAGTRTLKMRAGGNEISELLDEGIGHEKAGNIIEATSAYTQALKLAGKQYRLSELFNNLAWQYLQTNQSLEKALHLSQVANDLSPMNANYIDTLADILVKVDQKETAIQVLERSVGQLPGLSKKLAELKTQ